MRSPQGPVASFPGWLGPLLPGTRDLAGSSAPLLAGSCPVFSADVTFVCQQHLFRHDNLQPHWSAHLLQTSLVPRRLCVFILFYFFQFLPVWVLPSCHTLYSDLTFFPEPSSTIRARVFFLPSPLKAVGVPGISPLTTSSFKSYLCGKALCKVR